VVEPALTIAATLSSRSPFLAPLEKRAEADRAKRSFSRPRDKSDHLLSVRAFEQWEAARQGGAREERRFCEQSFLSSTSLRTIADLRTQFREVLADSGFAAARPRGGKARRWDAAGDDANANANNTRVLRAVICAGLYPNVVRVQRPETTYVEQVAGAVAQAPTAKQLKMFTQADGRVFLHPSSVNFTDADFVSPWLVFHQKQATSKVFIRDSSMVTPYALLLFGGELEVLHQRSEVHLDGWIRFAAQPRTGALVRALRGLLDDAVEAKLARPDADLSAHPAIAALLKILAFE
jgi:ATP-dependent RNA helicase DHX57